MESVVQVGGDPEVRRAGGLVPHCKIMSCYMLPKKNWNSTKIV